MYLPFEGFDCWVFRHHQNQTRRKLLLDLSMSTVTLAVITYLGVISSFPNIIPWEGGGLSNVTCFQPWSQLFTVNE